MINLPIWISMIFVSYTAYLNAAHQEENLKAGDVIIFSSGTTNPIPSSYRTIKAGPTMFSEAINKFPNIFKNLTPDETLYINCYPAFIPFPKSAVYTDTYLDFEKAFASLKLAYDKNLNVVLIAQPLFALELCLRYRDNGFNFPKRLIFTLGGYPIPGTLLKKLIEVCKNNNCDMTWLAGYGVAEIDAGLFYGMEIHESGEILYYPRSDVKIEIGDIDDLGFGEMRISKNDGPQNELLKDKAKKMDDAYIIRVEEKKIGFKAFQMLENWSDRDWERKTGYFHCDLNGKCFFQLRQAEHPESNDELTFFSFIEKINGSSNWWAKKPSWRFKL